MLFAQTFPLLSYVNKIKVLPLEDTGTVKVRIGACEVTISSSTNLVLVTAVPCASDGKFSKIVSFWAVWLNTAKDPQRTAKEHYGLSCKKWAPIELKIFHMLPDLVENLRSLIASQYAEADCAICGRGNFFVSVIRSIGSPSLTGRRYQRAQVLN